MLSSKKSLLLPSLPLKNRKKCTPLLALPPVCLTLLCSGRIQACGWTLPSYSSTSQRKALWPPSSASPWPLVKEGTPAPHPGPTHMSLWGWRLDIILLTNIWQYSSKGSHYLKANRFRRFSLSLLEKANVFWADMHISKVSKNSTKPKIFKYLFSSPPFSNIKVYLDNKGVEPGKDFEHVT